MAATETGPNNARCVVWAPRYVFFFFIHVLCTIELLLLCLGFLLKARGGLDWAATKK